MSYVDHSSFMNEIGNVPILLILSATAQAQMSAYVIIFNYEKQTCKTLWPHLHDEWGRNLNREQLPTSIWFCRNISLSEVRKGGQASG